MGQKAKCATSNGGSGCLNTTDRQTSRRSTGAAAATCSGRHAPTRDEEGGGLAGQAQGGRPRGVKTSGTGDWRRGDTGPAARQATAAGTTTYLSFHTRWRCTARRPRAARWANEGCTSGGSASCYNSGSLVDAASSIIVGLGNDEATVESCLGRGAGRSGRGWGPGRQAGQLSKAAGGGGCRAACAGSSLGRTAGSGADDAATAAAGGVGRGRDAAVQLDDASSRGVVFVCCVFIRPREVRFGPKMSVQVLACHQCGVRQALFFDVVFVCAAGGRCSGKFSL